MSSLMCSVVVTSEDSRSLTSNLTGPAIDDPLVVSRSLALMWGFGALLLAVTVALHRSRGADDAVLVAVIAAAAAGAVMLALVRDIKPRAVELVIVSGTALIGVLIVFGGKVGEAYAAFYVWQNVHAFYFLPWRRAALQLAVMVLSCPLALALGSPSGGAWAVKCTVAIGTLLVSGLFVGLLKERVTRLLASLAEAAHRDVLTGLLNRRGFEDALPLEVERASRGGRPLSLLLIDIDHFKQINDRCGHQAGDLALARVASALAGELRQIETVARIGGEEFAVLLPDTGEHGAFVAAQRLRGKVAAAAGEGGSQLTVSIGVASIPTHASDGEALVQAADRALYAAKSLGRDRAALYSAEAMRYIFEEQAGGGQQESAQIATMVALAEALDTRDAHTATHSRTVGRYAQMIASELGLPPERARAVGIAGVLHDIGKIAVPDAILFKPGPLAADERELIKEHPGFGARLLSAPAFGEIRGWVLAHHERPDGHGYPFGLAGEAIPLEAKILAVADAFEAMTSGHAGRPAIDRQAALAELQKAAGTKFDARVVQALSAISSHIELSSQPPIAAG